jgi:hypothetical protein
MSSVAAVVVMELNNVKNMSCYKCRTFDPIRPLDLDSKYCTKCGKSLEKICLSCHGTGLSSFMPKYCENCGGAINQKCTTCNGSGYTKGYHACF